MVLSVGLGLSFGGGSDVWWVCLVGLVMMIMVDQCGGPRVVVGLGLSFGSGFGVWWVCLVFLVVAL